MYTFLAAAYGDGCNDDHKKNGKLIWQEDLKSFSNCLKICIFFEWQEFNKEGRYQWYNCVKNIRHVLYRRQISHFHYIIQLKKWNG